MAAPSLPPKSCTRALKGCNRSVPFDFVEGHLATKLQYLSQTLRGIAHESLDMCDHDAIQIDIKRSRCDLFNPRQAVVYGNCTRPINLKGMILVL